MYRAYGLLQPTSNFSLATAALKLADKFPGYRIAEEGQRITVSKGDWEIHLTLNDGPEVLEESQTLAEQLSDGEEGAKMASSASRVEVYSDAPDKELEHFNDYLGMIEVLVSFRGLIAIDPEEPSLL